MLGGEGGSIRHSGDIAVEEPTISSDLNLLSTVPGENEYFLYILVALMFIMLWSVCSLNLWDMKIV